MSTQGNESEVSEDGVRAGVKRAAEPPRLDGTDATEDPRTVTTGGKIEAYSFHNRHQAPKGIDSETGEPVEVYVFSPHNVQITRHLVVDAAASARAAQIDALAFTVVPPEGESMRWVMEQMQSFLPIDRVEHRNGCFGFKQSARFGNGAGVIAWGGKSQRGRVYFSIQGQGCSTVSDWAGLATWLDSHLASIKRADVAYDDFGGDVASIAWAVDQYATGGFKAGGRKPQHHVFGDWLAGESSSKGRTLGIGSRKSGKYCRIYEKGKQLGNPTSPWTRVEVEWHGKDRLIPYEVLTAPGKYLAGAYPCFAFLNAEQARIKTIANSATISFDSAVEHGKQQLGKLVNLMSHVYGGDLGRVVNELWRDGIPARIEPYSYHLAGSPELLDPESPGSFASMLPSD